MIYEPRPCCYCVNYMKSENSCAVFKELNETIYCRGFKEGKPIISNEDEKENKIMKFRKKPIIIEAIQFNGENMDEIKSLFPDIKCFSSAIGHFFHIETEEGTMCAMKGDWIIKGVKGEFYPCKPDIFVETYEQLDESAEAKS